MSSARSQFLRRFSVRAGSKCHYGNPEWRRPEVKAHWDWAFRTVWFFGVLTVVRLALLWRSRPDPRGLLAALAIAGLIGVVLLGKRATTADDSFISTESESYGSSESR